MSTPHATGPTHATPDHHKMVRHLGYEGTIAIMKGNRLTPAFSAMSTVIVLVAAAFAVATTFRMVTIFP